MRLALRLAAGVGILGALSLFGCAATVPPSEQYTPDLQWCHNSCDGDHSGWCGLCDQNYTGWRERPMQPELEAEKNSLTVAATTDAELIEFLDYPPRPLAIPETRTSVFGTFTTDAEGRLLILPTNEIRNAENEIYGWLIWVGPTSEPVQWAESITFPDGVEFGGGWTAVSSDGRTATSSDAMVPDQGFIYSRWWIGDDYEAGNYEFAVSLPGGRTETFPFTLGPPQDACPAMGVFVDSWWKEFTPGGDPENRDASERASMMFFSRIVDHGFVTVDLEDAYWVLTVIATRIGDDRELAHGHIEMRSIADFQGKARRYDFGTVGESGTLDYSFLFATPINQLDDYMRTLADNFAAKLIPHARHVCSDWWSGQLEEEARLEEIRTQLELEIIRVRERRAEQEKRLKLEVEH